MVEELKLAIKIDDATVEQSLLKQFANAQKMADKVVLDFKNVNFDDKQIEAKFKEMQKKAGQNPIDLSISGNTLDMLGQIDKRLTEIFSIGKGKSFIDSSSTVADIGKIENKINELNKKYEEMQKKLSSVGSGGISGKDVSLVDNAEFQKLTKDVENTKTEINVLKENIVSLFEGMNNDERVVDRMDEDFQDMSLTIDNLIDKIHSLQEELKIISSIPSHESNISLGDSSAIDAQNKLQEELKETQVQAEKTAQAVLKVTGYRGTNGGDPVTSNKSGATFWDSKKNVAKMYGTNSSDKTLWSSELSFKNPLMFDAKKQKYGDITYLGDGADKASEAIIELTQRENALRKALDNSTKSGLEEVKMAYELQDVCKKIAEISNDTSNPYGTHSTDWFAEYAKHNGYDGVAIKNVLDTPDSYAKNGTEVSDVYITFQREQLQNTTLLAKANKELADSEREVALAELGVVQNTNSNSGNNLENKIKEIFTDTKELKQVLDSLHNGSYFSFDLGESDDALGRVQELREILSQYGYTIKNYKDDTEAFRVSGVISSLEKENDALEKNTQKVKENVQAHSQNPKKDAFPNTDTKLDDIVSTAKELDKTLEQVDIPTDSFDEVLKKLNLAKSELVDIVKITEKSSADKDGKFHTSYTLKDSRGSTEIYGLNSKTDKGQLLDHNIVRYDKKKDELDVSKAQLEIDKQLAKEEENLAKTQQKKAQAFLKEQTNYENKQKKVEFIKKQTAAYDELTNTISKYSEVAKRVASGKAEDGDLELMTKLEDKISQLQKQPILSDSQVAKSEKILVSLYDQLDKIERKLVETNQKSQDKQVSGFDKRLSGYESKLTNYQATKSKFEDGGWTSDKYTQNIDALNAAIKNYKDLLADVQNKGIASDKDIENLNQYESEIKQIISTVQNMSAAEKGFTFLSGQKELDKINSILTENSAMSREAKAQIRAYYAEIKSGNPSASLDVIHAKIMEIVNAEAEAGRTGKSMFDAIKEKAWYGVASAIGTYFGFNDILRYGGEVVNTVKDLNTQITELAKLSEQSSKQIYADFDSYADIAKEVRGTISDTIAATADWSKNGYSIPYAKELAEVSQLYKNVGDGINIDEANESLISTLKGFKLEADEAEHIVDVFNEVSKHIGEVA